MLKSAISATLKKLNLRNDFIKEELNIRSHIHDKLQSTLPSLFMNYLFVVIPLLYNKLRAIKLAKVMEHTYIYRPF